MNKKYQIIEIGANRLWVNAITRREATKQLTTLQARFPFRQFIINVK